MAWDWGEVQRNDDWATVFITANETQDGLFCIIAINPLKTTGSTLYFIDFL